MIWIELALEPNLGTSKFHGRISIDIKIKFFYRIGHGLKKWTAKHFVPWPGRDRWCNDHV